MVDSSREAHWARCSVWADVLTESPVDATGPAGVNVTPREGLCVVSIQARRGGEAAIASLVKARYGLDLPMKPRVVQSGTHAFVWAGPGQWLLVAEQAESLAELQELAAVSNQSDGRAALRLSGLHVCDMLAKGCMIDLHPSAFPSGATAMTSIAHIGVHLWRLDLQPPDGGAAFDILIARSMAGSFWSWASASAAEFGCRVTIAR